MATTIDGVKVALPAPDGYVVDFDHPQRSDEIAAYWVYGAGNLICLFFMFQRAYVRCVIQKTFRSEDACLFVAYAFSIALQTMILCAFIQGIIGVHSWEIPLSKFKHYYVATYLIPILYNPVQCGAKMALLLIYRRLAPQKWFQAMVWVASFFVIGSSIAITFTTIFPCRPVSGAWKYGVKGIKCINRTAVYEATAVLGAVTDVMVLAVPMPVVLPLQISKRQKIGLIAIFSVGAITVFTSIMRLVTLVKSMNNADQTWGGAPVMVWIMAESNLSCICASLPTIKPFLVYISPRILGSTNPRSKTGPSMSRRSVPRTFGTGDASRVRQDKYQRFDDVPMYPLQTRSNIEAERVEAAGPSASGSAWAESSFEGRRDGDSEKGIIQTRTTTVSYS